MQKSPVGLSEPNSRLYSKRQNRTQRDARLNQERAHQLDSEANYYVTGYPRANTRGYDESPIPSYSSSASNISPRTRTISHDRSDYQSAYADDELSTRTPTSHTSMDTESYARRYSPSRGRPRQARLRGILRTPSQSRNRSSPDRRGSSSRSTGRRVTFALRDPSSDEEPAGRRNSISDVPPNRDYSRIESRTRQRPRNWGDVAAMRAEKSEAPKGRDGFSDSSKTIHPKAHESQRWRNVSAHPRQIDRSQGRRREYSSSDGEMQEWRTRARQRSLQRGERLRKDHRTEVRKARRHNRPRYDSSSDEADGKRNRP